MSEPVKARDVQVGDLVEGLGRVTKTGDLIPSFVSIEIDHSEKHGYLLPADLVLSVTRPRTKKQLVVTIDVDDDYGEQIDSWLRLRESFGRVIGAHIGAVGCEVVEIEENP